MVQRLGDGQGRIEVVKHKSTVLAKCFVKLQHARSAHIINDCVDLLDLQCTARTKQHQAGAHVRRRPCFASGDVARGKSTHWVSKCMQSVYQPPQPPLLIARSYILSVGLKPSYAPLDDHVNNAAPHQRTDYRCYCCCCVPILIDLGLFTGTFKERVLCSLDMLVLHIQLPNHL